MPLFKQNPQLLAAFRAGERAAQEKVYRFYVRRVDAHLRNLALRTGAVEMAQSDARGDVVQEVFVRAFSKRARSGYDSLRDYGPYLHTIARNCLVDAIRKGARELIVAPDSLALASRQSVTLDLTEPRVSAVLRQYLSDLPDDLKKVYEHRYVHGAAQVAACKALGLSRRQLRTREAHLRQGLRKALVHAGVPVPSCASGSTSPTRHASLAATEGRSR